jgi:uncharacterized radical SAM superfamily Fe-S cluster-containing enzyme
MSLEDFKKWVDIDMQYMDKKRIALLGGEPTIHAEFGRFLEYALTKTVNVTVFTNLMATKKNAKDLIRIATANPELSVVWNNSEFDTVPETHRVNSSRVATELNKVCYMFHSVTYTPGLDLSYLLPIAEKTGIRKIRFALNVSEMHRCIELENLEILYNQLSLLIDNGFTVAQDSCGFIPNSIPALFRLRFNHLINYVARCDGNASDVLPDGRIIPCMPYLDDPKELYVTDIQSGKHLQEMFVKHYGPQASRKITQGMCPATYERPANNKVIPILQIQEEYRTRLIV